MDGQTHYLIQLELVDVRGYIAGIEKQVHAGDITDEQAGEIAALLKSVNNLLRPKKEQQAVTVPVAVEPEAEEKSKRKKK